MPTNAELLAALDQISPPTPESKLSTADNIMGYSRAYLNGPLFGFEPQIESAIASIGAPGDYSENYANELANIKNQRSAFLAENPVTGYGTEIASSIALNPLSELGKLAQGAKYGLNTAIKAVTNPVSQGAIAGVGNKRDDETIWQAAKKGALFGAVASGTASVLGKTLQAGADEAEKLKLSAFGITAADLNLSAKKTGDALSKVEDLPIVQTVAGAEKAKIIKAGADVLDNIKGVASTQNTIAADLTKVLDKVDEVAPKNINFEIPNSEKYLDRLSGTAKTDAEKMLLEEYVALTEQMTNGGTLADLQKAKVGLNYKFDTNSTKVDVIKTLRSDLRAAIEKRVNDAAESGLVDKSYFGLVKNLNSKWGNLAELKDAFAKKVSRDYGPDAVEQLFGQMRTTNGTGSLNIISGATGNPIYMMAGQALNLARGPEAKNAIADILIDFKKPLKAAGDLLSGEATAGRLGNIPAPVTARSSIQMIDAAKGPEQSKQKTLAPDTLKGLRSKLMEFDELMKKKSSIGDVSMTDQEDPIEPLVRAVIQQESGGNPRAVSNKGAQGLMQVLPSTASEIAKGLGLTDYDLRDPETNKVIGTAYLQQLLKQFNGDPELALTAYHSGPGRVERLLKTTGGSKLEDIIDYLGPIGRKYAKEVLEKRSKVKTSQA